MSEEKDLITDAKKSMKIENVNCNGPTKRRNDGQIDQTSYRRSSMLMIFIHSYIVAGFLK